MRGVLLCWPLMGAPLAFFELDGDSFKFADLCPDYEGAVRDALDVAIDEAIEWGMAPTPVPPAGWRIALEGELRGPVRFS